MKDSVKWKLIWKKKKCYETLKKTISVQIVTDRKQLKNLELLNYLRRLTTNDERYTREIKSKIAMTKDAFNERNSFTSKLDLKFKESTSEKYFFWGGQEGGME